MKIRIKENSIRLRLTKTEVASFIENKSLVQSTNFGNSVFKYCLVASDTDSGLNATFKENTITVFLPNAFLEKWKEQDKIGFTETINLGGSELKIKVEKDFVCLDDTDEDQSDNYPNPNQSK